MISTDPATRWAEDVVEGRVVAGPHVRASCRRHLRDLETAGARGLVFDIEEAARVIDFFPRNLRLNAGQFDRKPFELEPSQKFKIGCLFGWKWKDTGLRRFQRFYSEEGKKNGKSALMAGVGLYGLTADDEKGAEIYAAAATQKQAEVVFRDAVAMVRSSPRLSRRVVFRGGVDAWKMNFVSRAKDLRFFRTIAARAAASGPRPHFGLIDEVHEHTTRDIIDMIEQGFGFRLKPLLFMSTNAGHDRQSVCWEEHEAAISVAHGDQKNDELFSFVAGLDDGDDWQEDPECWVKANPLLGVTMLPRKLASEVKKTLILPGKRNVVARLHFCEWTQSETQAFSKQAWKACQIERKPDRELQGVPCFGGLDLSKGGGDFTALTLLWLFDATPDAQRFVTRSWFWAPSTTIAKQEVEDGAHYSKWVDEGYIEAVDGPRLRYGFIADRLVDIVQRYQPEEIAADSYGLDNLREHLDERGFETPMVKHPQGFNMNILERAADRQNSDRDVYLWMPDSINKFEAALVDERMGIERNPLLSNMAGAAVFRENATGHRMFTKEGSHGRIDGVVSNAMAIGIATCKARSLSGGYTASQDLVVL